MIEYAIELHDSSAAKEAIDKATRLAIAYLDEEEKKLRGLAELFNLTLTSKGKEFQDEYKIKQ